MWVLAYVVLALVVADILIYGLLRLIHGSWRKVWQIVIRDGLRDIWRGLQGVATRLKARGRAC